MSSETLVPCRLHGVTTQKTSTFTPFPRNERDISLRHSSYFCPQHLSLLFVLINVKLSLSFNWSPRHEGVLEVWKYSSTHPLTSALDGGEWSASRPGHFTPRERAPGTHWIGGWVGPRAVLDVVVKRKIPSPSRESIPRTPIVQPVDQSYTDWAITALFFFVLISVEIKSCYLLGELFVDIHRQK
jgi:hypothetical protein